MILADHEIRRLCLAPDVGQEPMITPFSECVKRSGVISYGVSSYGYDARLGRNFKVFSPVVGDLVIDPKKSDERAYHTFEGDVCVIPPNSYVLGETVETFCIPRDVIGVCLGKSSYSRCGLIVNVTPLEPAWMGKITIEISNSSPLPARVYAMEGIMQILFFRASSQCEVSYADKKGKYQNQTGLTLPRVD